MDVVKDGRLQRMGNYEIKRVSKGPTPLPASGVSGPEASRLWAGLVERWLERRGFRLKAIDDLQAAEQGGDRGSIYTATLVKYSNKITIKSIEAVLELFHRVAAPEVKDLCDHRCPHLAQGLAPAQVKQIVDSLQAALARIDDWLKVPSLSDDERSDSYDERGEYTRGLEALQALLDGPAARR